MVPPKLLAWVIKNSLASPLDQAHHRIYGLAANFFAMANHRLERKRVMLA